MPIATIYLLEGRTPEQKKELIKNVSSAIIHTLAAPPESVRVILNEMPFDHYGIAGLPVLEYRTQKEKPKTNKTSSSS
jgi:4-oxalocrotonate tautomerase